MILVYFLSVGALFVYRIGISVHPWVAPGVVLVMTFCLLFWGVAKVDDWWASRGGTIPANILSEEKSLAQERARRSVGTYAPLAVMTFWLAYGLIFHGEGCARNLQLVSELVSNAASLVVFLLVVATYMPTFRLRTWAVVTTGVLILAISLFVPGTDSLPSLANVLVSLHKVTAFSLLYFLIEMGAKLRRAPLRNGYSSSYLRKFVQTAWILFSGRFVSLLAWAQVGLAIWTIRRRSSTRAKVKVDLESSVYPTSPSPPPPLLAQSQTPPPQQQQQQQPSLALQPSPIPNGTYAVPTASDRTTRLDRSSSGPKAQQQQPQGRPWPPRVIHSPHHQATRSSSEAGGLTGIQRASSRDRAAIPSGRLRQQKGQRRPVASHGTSPLDLQGNCL